MPERHYGLVIASLVAVVAIVGLVLNFSGLTGAMFTQPKLISEAGNYVEAGVALFSKCHSDLEGMNKELQVAEGESMPENECCSRLCGQLCSGLSGNCYTGCRSGCSQGAKLAYGSGY